MSRQYVHATNRNPIDDYQKTVLNVVVLILLRSTSRLSWKRTVTVGYVMMIVDVIWRKSVSIYAISACEALVASVNSVNSVNNSLKVEHVRRRSFG